MYAKINKKVRFNNKIEIIYIDSYKSYNKVNCQLSNDTRESRTANPGFFEFLEYLILYW